jgi:hypothetical protein
LHRIYITLKPVNDSPVLLNPLSDISVNEFDEYLFIANTSSFSDPDGDILTLQVQVVSGNWIQKKNDNQIEGFPLPGSDDKAVVTVRATDTQGAWVEDTFELNVVRKKRPLIYGQILSSSSLPDKLIVALLAVNGKEIDTTATTNTNGRNYYFFEDAGKYIIKAVNNNPVTHPQLVSTYYETTADWTKATNIDVAGNNQYVANITMLQNPVTTGKGSISGFVRVLKVSSPVQGGLIGSGSEGDALPYADLTLTSKGTILLRTQSGLDGSYTFSNLPSGEYIVAAELPGFTSVKPYTLNITDAKSSYVNINFTAYLGNGVITDKKEINQFDMVLYPNPTSGLVNLRSSNADKTVFVRVIDLNGQILMKKQFEPAFLSQFNIRHLLPATYIIEVKQGDQVKTFPVLLMNSK